MTDQSQLEARIVELTPQPAAAVRIQRAMADLDLPRLFDEHLPQVAARVADLGGEMAGPPYGRYHEFGPERADVEIGVVVAAPIANLRPLAECEPGEIGATELPGGRGAATIHVGSYDGLSRTYERLHSWIHAQGGEEGSGPWESYVDDPAEVEDPSQLRTEVIWPLA